MERLAARGRARIPAKCDCERDRYRREGNLTMFASGFDGRVWGNSTAKPTRGVERLGTARASNAFRVPRARRFPEGSSITALGSWPGEHRLLMLGPDYRVWKNATSDAHERDGWSDWALLDDHAVPQ